MHRLDQLDRVRRHPALIKSLVISIEAPFFAEVSSNLFFLFCSDEYYAYYLPTEVFHLTSVQVIPVYALSLFLCLTLYAKIERFKTGWHSPVFIYLGGIAFVAMG